MLSTLIEWDTELFGWINSHYCDVADWVMWTASQSWSWALVLVVAFALLTLRREPRMWWVVLLGIALCFLLSDRISVMAFKDVVCRLRPCHAIDNVRMFRTHCGGQYGFVSSHAANVYALAMFFSLRYGKRERLGWVAPLLFFAWAVLVGYSRPYLGKHYPGDVICGAILGIGIGAFVSFFCYWLQSLLARYKAKRNVALPPVDDENCI